MDTPDFATAEGKVYISRVQRALENASPIGAFSMGIITLALYQDCGMLPSLWMLERAAECTSVQQAAQLVDQFKRDLIELMRRNAQPRPRAQKHHQQAE